MKEKPIIFNGEMVRAILDGRKTQTRRTIKYPVILQSATRIKLIEDEFCELEFDNPKTIITDGERSLLLPISKYSRWDKGRG